MNNALENICIITKNTESKVLRKFTECIDNKAELKRRFTLAHHDTKITKLNDISSTNIDNLRYIGDYQSVKQSLLSYSKDFSEPFSMEKLKERYIQRSNITFESFIDIARDKFILEKDNAILLARYIFSSNTESQSETKLEVSSDYIEQKLKEFTSVSNIHSEDYLKVIALQIVENLDKNELRSFLTKLQNILKSEYIIPYDLIKVVYNLPLIDVKIEIDSLIILLLRKSKSLIKIKSSVIKSEIIDMIKFITKVKFKSKTLIVDKVSERYKNNEEISRKEQSNLKISVVSKNTEESIEEQQSNQKAELMLNQRKESISFLNKFTKVNKTISEIISSKIFDQVIDGKEYQLIRRGDLIKSFENEGILITNQEINCIKDVIQPIWIDSIDAKNLEEITKSFGINEDYPTNNRHLDYSTLTGPAIRTFNKIIKYMNESNTTDIMSIIPKNLIRKITCISKSKEEIIDYITSSDLEDVFRSKNILKRSENLNQEIIDFTEINQNCENMIMIRKLRRCITDIKNSKYFNRFGILPRKIVQTDVQNCIKKAVTFYQTSDYTNIIDRSINKVEAKVESKLMKARANVSVLKWKAFMIKGSKFLKSSEETKIIDDFVKGNLGISKNRQKLNNNEEFEHSTEIDPFNEISINREIMRKKFGLYSKC